MQLGPLELMIILVIVLLLFGSGRVAKLGGELGTAMREFRRGVQNAAPTTGETQAEDHKP